QSPVLLVPGCTVPKTTIISALKSLCRQRSCHSPRLVVPADGRRAGLTGCCHTHITRTPSIPPLWVPLAKRGDRITWDPVLQSCLREPFSSKAVPVMMDGGASNISPVHYVMINVIFASQQGYTNRVTLLAGKIPTSTVGIHRGGISGPGLRCSMRSYMRSRNTTYGGCDVLEIDALGWQVEEQIDWSSLTSLMVTGQGSPLSGCSLKRMKPAQASSSIRLAWLNIFGWTPVDIGPSTLERISSLLLSCKKILWIGTTTSYDLTEEFSVGATQLGQILNKASHNSCDVIIVGSAACKAVKGISDSSSQYTAFENESVVWEFLKGRILPGIAALDKSYPYQIPWDDVFSDNQQPLFLVVRCLKDVASAGKRNLYFLSTNATSTFRSIVSSYPGQLTLVAIQCPNPDFNKEQNRWRMVRRMLVEAVADLLQVNGKIYLQSDVESVLLGMKEQFISHGKGQLVVDSDDSGNCRMENPFGVVSDWERHVLARGAPMYRTMLRKV
ncbi:hypothetical protein ZWY2020_005674, partial [Hordeum vulgare]